MSRIMSVLGRKLLLPSLVRASVASSHRTFFCQSRIGNGAFHGNSFYTNSSNALQNVQNQDGRKDDKYTASHRKKMANYYSMLIASIVGMIGSSYLLYNKYHSVDAKDKEEVEDVDGTTEEDSDTLHKSQAGFRERKVNGIHILYSVFYIYIEVVILYINVNKN